MNNIKKNLRDVGMYVDRKIVFQQFKRQNNTAIVNHRPIRDWKGREETADTMLHTKEANGLVTKQEGADRDNTMCHPLNLVCRWESQHFWAFHVLWCRSLENCCYTKSHSRWRAKCVPGCVSFLSLNHEFRSLNNANVSPADCVRAWPLPAGPVLGVSHNVVKVLAGYGLDWRLHCTDLLPSSLAGSSMTEVPVFLLGISWGPQHLQVTLRSFPRGPTY